MKKLLNSTTTIILGIIIFLIGCIQPAKYEKAKENGYEVDATIVDVVVKIENDMDGYTSTSYTVYADYEVNEKQYEHVKVGKYYDTDEYYVGKTIKVVVDPNNQGSTLYEGGILCVVGFLLSVVAIIYKITKKRNA